MAPRSSQVVLHRSDQEITVPVIVILVQPIEVGNVFLKDDRLLHFLHEDFSQQSAPNRTKDDPLRSVFIISNRKI